jgi:hypothetical protein
MYFNASTQPDTKSTETGDAGGFLQYKKKAASDLKISPETRFYMQQKAGSATNLLMRSKTLADYGLNLGDGSPHTARYFHR